MNVSFLETKKPCCAAADNGCVAVNNNKPADWSSLTLLKSNPGAAKTASTTLGSNPEAPAQGTSWLKANSTGQWGRREQLAADMDHGAKAVKPPSGKAAEVAMQGFEVAASVLTPILEIRETNLLRERASWDPEARAKLAQAEHSRNFAMAATVFPAGKVFKLARVGEALAGPVAKVLEHLMAQEGAGFSKEAIAESLANLATKRTQAAGTLTEQAMTSAAKQVTANSENVLKPIIDSMAKEGVKLSPEELAVFKRQVAEEYALKFERERSIVISTGVKDSALKVAGERWGLGVTGSGRFGTTLVGTYVKNNADDVLKAAKAAGVNVSPQQANSLRETLTHLYQQSINSVDTLPARTARDDEFQKMAHQVAHAMFGT